MIRLPPLSHLPWERLHPGMRLVVRYRRAGQADIGGSAEPFTDAVGELLSTEGSPGEPTTAALRVQTRWTEVHIPWQSVVAVKEIPPAPVRAGARSVSPSE
ncbi:hypothetical protein [Psychromicrobium xiongbiense]|uniref:putative acetyltransferase n=1 Tax=Psychromicrobium xiongbiense TaxID=3051184 RepID=UPI002553E9D1|nr:hypothetical protein [Psychromicrobium sp. YIM S02556]